MTSKDLELFAGTLAVDIKQLTTRMIADAVAPVRARCEELEAEVKALRSVDVVAAVKAQVLAEIPTPRDGRDGVSIDPSVVDVMVSGAVATAIKSLPVPKDGDKGADGRDGSSVSIEDVRPVIAAEVAKAVAAIPVPKDGAPGPQGDVGPQGPQGLSGEKGLDGRDGKDGAPGPMGEKGLDGRDGKDGAPGPMGEKGLDGRDGSPGERGPQGEKGLDGRDGVPGERGAIGEKGLDGVAGRDGRDGLPGVPGPQGDKGMDGKDGINGKDGANGIHGKDGIDGLGFEDLDFAFDEHGRLLLKFSRGDRVKSAVVPSVVYHGIWEPRAYVLGTTVTQKGNLWIAVKDTSDKPGESSDWRLCARAGRDGKAGLPGRDGVIRT
jgi:hypothetical protein